eukprot:CAMPEP_0201587662 /NCGR_PEP_ID=MMETSP0190_2-20130828/146062_1 /ASSEMBLY_ACC=CAM_ASM_000263 /TAXON_ID=37353 /ORGANISM="Rosalina sp." /LENGTH=52 /DNA_ID=CAMNT_0048038163 /DNA_START=127 /DNA_END=281 /DNA_ORIENTATION=-
MDLIVLINKELTHIVIVEELEQYFDSLKSNAANYYPIGAIMTNNLQLFADIG